MTTTELSERQLEIIGAAGHILTAEGVGGLTIKNLANEMNFSEAAIYRHFSGKEEIIVAMLNYLAQRMDQAYSDLSRITDTEERFKAIFQQQLKFFRKNPHFVAVVFADGLLEESRRINDGIAKIMAVKIKHLAPVIKEGQQRGIFTAAIHAEDLTHIVMGAFRLQMFKWRISDFQSDIKKTGDAMIRSILVLIKNK